MAPSAIAVWPEGENPQADSKLHGPGLDRVRRQVSFAYFGCRTSPLAPFAPALCQDFDVACAKYEL